MNEFVQNIYEILTHPFGTIIKVMLNSHNVMYPLLLKKYP